MTTMKITAIINAPVSWAIIPELSLMPEQI